NMYASQSLSEGRNRNSDRQIGLSLSMPLDIGHSSNVTLDTQSSGSRHSQRASLSGSLDDNRLSYRTSLSSDDGHQRSVGVSAGYQAAFGSVGAGVTQG
ncbi:fimbria/pilus outer membrane usher protein, partial [Pseudomonas viridiflava]|uniref:fimbria/pilus outer membrane usher protein n=1 Tax=Pseudomonas viridiflava TaxID=33069 RepID=UPI0013CF1CDB